MQFFPEEAEYFQEVAEKVVAIKSKKYIARLKDFDSFIDKLIDFKDVQGIYNTSSAMLEIIEMLDKYLEEQAKLAEAEAEHDHN